MNKRARNGPLKLAAKLKQIREGLGLSQSQMAARLESEDLINRTHIANFERGEREPTLPILLKYSRGANIYMEVLADDALDLVEGELPCREKSSGVSANK